TNARPLRGPTPAPPVEGADARRPVKGRRRRVREGPDLDGRGRGDAARDRLGVPGSAAPEIRKRPPTGRRGVDGGMPLQPPLETDRKRTGPPPSSGSRRKTWQGDHRTVSGSWPWSLSVLGSAPARHPTASRRRRRHGHWENSRTSVERSPTGPTA